MTILSIALFLVLTIIAAIHLYWGFGGLWPGHDERSLAKTVLGANDATKMPPAWLTLFVAGAIFIAGIFPLMWSAVISYTLPQILVWIGMWGLTLIFLGRGFGGYLPVFRNANSEQPFADLDRKYYSPLCILIGLGFLILIILAR